MPPKKQSQDFPWNQYFSIDENDFDNAVDICNQHGVISADIVKLASKALIGSAKPTKNASCFAIEEFTKIVRERIEEHDDPENIRQQVIDYLNEKTKNPDSSIIKPSILDKKYKKEKSPVRKPSPVRKVSVERKVSPVRKVSVERKVSPVRKVSVERKVSPVKKVSIERKVSPVKKVSIEEKPLTIERGDSLSSLVDIETTPLLMKEDEIPKLVSVDEKKRYYHPRLNQVLEMKGWLILNEIDNVEELLGAIIDKIYDETILKQNQIEINKEELEVLKEQVDQNLTNILEETDNENVKEIIQDTIQVQDNIQDVVENIIEQVQPTEEIKSKSIETCNMKEEYSTMNEAIEDLKCQDDKICDVVEKKCVEQKEAKKTAIYPIQVGKENIKLSGKKAAIVITAIKDRVRNIEQQENKKEEVVKQPRKKLFNSITPSLEEIESALEDMIDKPITVSERKIQLGNKVAREKLKRCLGDI